MNVSSASLNLEKQMTIPFNISAKFEIMGYEKLNEFFLLQTSTVFERLIYYICISRSFKIKI